MLSRTLQHLAADEHGATAIEYALLALLIAVAVIAGLTVFGDAVANLFDSPAIDTLSNAADSL